MSVKKEEVFGRCSSEKRFLSKIHPILMYNLRVFCDTCRSLVITCKQNVLLFVYRVLNVLINTKEKTWDYR